MAGKINPKQLGAVAGTATGQVLSYDGSKWTARYPSQSFSKSYVPTSATYAPGVTVLQTYTPASGFSTIIPQVWTIPGYLSSNQLQPGIRFTWSDSSNTDSYTTSPASATRSRGTINFQKDGLRIVSVSFIAMNTTAGNITGTIGAYGVDGDQT